MRFVYDDGGREEAGYKGEAGDCVTRAIAIATGMPYRSIYDALAAMCRERGLPRSARNGVPKKVCREYMTQLGAKWIPTMRIGAGCTVHLRDGELPMGRLVVQVSKHYTAVINGVLHDTYDETRDGTRCVYGYYIIPAGSEWITLDVE